VAQALAVYAKLSGAKDWRTGAQFELTPAAAYPTELTKAADAAD
jgi:hypothetical protein